MAHLPSQLPCHGTFASNGGEGAMGGGGYWQVKMPSWPWGYGEVDTPIGCRAQMDTPIGCKAQMDTPIGCRAQMDTPSGFPNSIVFPTLFTRVTV